MELNPDTKIYRALQIPCHIGVPLFVMISGYFRIRWSLRGLVRLLSKAYVLFGSLAVLTCVVVGNIGIRNIVQNAMVIGFNNLWFLNVCLYLFLFAPVINKFLNNIQTLHRIYLLCTLAFMAIYIGNVTHSDSALVDGKNLTNFMLLYVVGDTVRNYQYKINRISMGGIIAAYFLLNFFLVLGVMYIPLMEGNIWKYAFGYNSPIMYINCILVLAIFSKINITNKFVNWAGGSIFACYLLQCPGILWENLFVIPVRHLDAILTTPYLTIPCICAYSLFIMLVFICVDKILSPLWDVFTGFGQKLDARWHTNVINS